MGFAGGMINASPTDITELWDHVNGDLSPTYLLNIFGGLSFFCLQIHADRSLPAEILLSESSRGLNCEAAKTNSAELVT